MQSPVAIFVALPSEILTMFYRNVDSIVDLQHLMLASPHKGSVHPQIALVIRIAAHLRCQSPPLMKLLSDLALRAFTPGLSHVIYGLDIDEFHETLPRDIKPSDVRRLITTSFAIHATTLRCVHHHLRRFHSLRPINVDVGDGIDFDLQKNKWTDLPTSPRSPIDNSGPLLWREMQQMLKAFWMIYIARIFLASRRRRDFELPERWKHVEVDDMKPIDLFGF
ncbi:hypothetical protein LTR95_001169 [Oleoguttula sp. CCFEE 5521]